MVKKSVSGDAVLRAALAFGLLFFAIPAVAIIIHVPGDYADIQDAIDAAAAGDTILFAAGGYTGDYTIDHGGITFLADGEVFLTSAIYDFFYCSLDIDYDLPIVMSGLIFEGNYRAIGYDMDCILDLSDCVFRDNNHGIFGCGPGPITITNCLFDANHAEHVGGAISACLAPLDVSDCVFSNNTAGFLGGAIYSDTPIDLRVFRHCLFIGNDAPQGAAVYAEHGGLVELENCTFYGNGGSGGTTLAVGMSQTLLNVEGCIVANSLGADFACIDGGNLVVLCTDSWNNAGGDWADCASGYSDQDGNFSLDPLFCDAPRGDFTLYNVSPCLPENNGCDTLIGAYGEGCTTTATERSNWSRVKRLY